MCGPWITRLDNMYQISRRRQQYVGETRNSRKCYSDGLYYVVEYVNDVFADATAASSFLLLLFLLSGEETFPVLPFDKFAAGVVSRVLPENPVRSLFLGYYKLILNFHVTAIFLRRRRPILAFPIPIFSPFNWSPLFAIFIRCSWMVSNARSTENSLRTFKNLRGLGTNIYLIIV